MQNKSKISKLVGWLFIGATFSGILSAILLEPALVEPDILLKISENKSSVIIGALLQIVMSVFIVIIPVILFPILEKHHKMIARGYLASRIIEVIPFFIGISSILILVGIDKNGSLEIAALLGHTVELNALIGGQIIFSLTALVLNYSLYVTKLIPQWLSLWGLAGVPLMFLSGIWGIYTFGEVSTVGLLLIVPLAMQEMAMAIWLIVKGFNYQK